MNLYRKLVIFLAYSLLSTVGICSCLQQPNLIINQQGSPMVSADTVIQVIGNEQQHLNLERPDGGLLPVPGVLNLQLLRTTSDAAEISDDDGWTYAHHMDLAEWRGRLYAAWNMTQKDEDVPPSKVVYATSADGIEWSKPADLFPRELAWACRFYFYHTKNDRMLAFCAARLGDGIVTEDLKSILLVREIFPDHRLGSVFTLVQPIEKMPLSFELSSDTGFVNACREAVARNMLLEQQDYGVFLGKRKMSWHLKTPKYKGFYPFGKAFCFYQRKDQKWVGISKMGFVTTSADEGKSWSEPHVPPTLIAGAAKVWGQRTSGNNYLLAYNPDPKQVKRFPLVMVNGADGINFRDMRVVHGEFPPLRYPGKYKDFGYQYVRGIAEWSTDHSRADSSAVWLIYSVHKEDIWLARIPLPIKSTSHFLPDDSFDKSPPGAIVPGWNIYSPKWAPVRIVQEPGNLSNQCLELKDSDPTDYARAMKLFPSSTSVTIKFRIKASQTDALLNLEIQDRLGVPLVTIQWTKDGKIIGSEKKIDKVIGDYVSGEWSSFEIKTDLKKETAKISINGQIINNLNVRNENELERLVFRTGISRKLGDTDQFIPGTDRPVQSPAVFLLDDVSVKK